jgi:glycosyltransferase involved in cell wall biosynthesis
MNVGVFTDNDFDKVNGVTTSLRAAIEYAPEDLHVKVYTSDSRGADTPTYLSLKARGMRIPFYREMRVYAPPMLEFLRRARADSLDVIHLTTPGPIGLAAMCVAARLSVPLLGSFHTNFTEYAEILSGSRRLGDMVQRYLRWLYGRCGIVLAPSEATRAMLIENRIAPRTIRLWRRGVSTGRYSPAKRSDHTRWSWGVSADRPALLYVGRLSREKGLEDLADVRRALEARKVPHRFIFVGDGPMRPALEDWFPSAVFTGTLAPDEVAVAMASSDVLLFPSRTDTAGNVVLESQACGLPVVVTDEGGPQENVLPEDTGIICANVRQLCRAAIELSANKARRDRMSRAARAYACARTWEDALAPLYESYRDAVCARGGRSSAATSGAPDLMTPRRSASSRQPAA